MKNREAIEILKELIARFDYLNETATPSSYRCWSCAHSMADDAKRAIACLRRRKTKGKL